MSRSALLIRVRIDNGPVVAVRGREAWALVRLMAAGEQGCTPIDTPAPRWSSYVHKLRKVGIDIETVVESHGGPFAGEHGRYVVRSTVAIIDSAAAIIDAA
jgi:hypothetical protein